MDHKIPEAERAGGTFHKLLVFISLHLHFLTDLKNR